MDIDPIDDKPVDLFDVLTKDIEGHLQYHYVLLQFLARKPELYSLQLM